MPTGVRLSFEQIPSGVSGMKTWGAVGKKRQYVIAHDMSDGKFIASYRRLGRSTTVHIVDFDNRVSTFEEAAAACEAVEKDN